MTSSSVAAPGGQYSLSSDLAKLCLPAATRDPNRKLAYVNSICFLFLIVGLVGLKMPRPYVRPLPEVTEIVPVVFTPPDQPPPQQTDQPQDQPEETRDAPLDAPVIATVVAADPTAVKFAVPVSGPVILAPARFAAPPPPQVKAPPAQPTRFVPTGKEAGTYPWPREYPRQALLQRQEGTVTLLVEVGADGAPTSVTVKDSSAYSVLDRFAVQWVRDKWRWPPGPVRQYYVPFEFHLR
jgi:periplasmic protein TonB